MCRDSSSNRNLFYVFTRIGLTVLIVIQLVWFVIALVDCNHCHLDNILWHCFAMAVLLIGLIGAWKEHFLSAAVFSITELLMLILGYAMFASNGNHQAIAIVLTLVGSAVYAVMLYQSGRRDMGMPEVCV